LFLGSDSICFTGRAMYFRNSRSSGRVPYSELTGRKITIRGWWTLDLGKGQDLSFAGTSMKREQIKEVIDKIAESVRENPKVFE
jgi:hypothetical protein